MQRGQDRARDVVVPPHGGVGDVTPFPAPVPSTVLAYLLALLCLGSLAAWLAPLHHDESVYYLPAIERMASALSTPARWLDYPLPTPPLALLLQSALSAAGATTLTLRMASTIAALATFILVARRILAVRRDDWHGAGLLLVIGSLPYFLTCAFQLRHHTLALFLFVSGFVITTRAEPRREEWYGATWTLWALASLTTQFVVPLIVALILGRLRDRMRRGTSLVVAAGEAVAMATCLLPLALLFVHWGGFQPPAYRGQLLESEVGLRLRPGQMVNIALCLGAWVSPLASWTWARVRLLGLLWLPSLALVHASGVFAPGAAFDDSVVGVISTAVRRLAPGPMTLPVIATLVASGASMLLPGEGAVLSVTGRMMIGAYALMLSMIPYQFESYCTTLLVSLMAVEAARLGSSGAWRAAAWILMPLVGWTYAATKLVTMG